MAVVDPYGAGLYVSDYLPPYVDHIHERPHHHQNLIQYLAHKRPTPAIVYPDVDMREADNEYAIDVELPGVRNKSSIKLEWISSRSLLISGNIERPALSSETKPSSAPPKEESSSTATTTGGRDANGEWVAPHDPEPAMPTLLVNERKTGPFQRHFHFHIDVDMKHLKAKLEDGLLSIRVRKQPSENIGTGRITIE